MPCVKLSLDHSISLYSPCSLSTSINCQQLISSDIQRTQLQARKAECLRWGPADARGLQVRGHGPPPQRALFDIHGLILDACKHWLSFAYFSISIDPFLQPQLQLRPAVRSIMQLRLWQLITITLCTFESLIAYRLKSYNEDTRCCLQGPLVGADELLTTACHPSLGGHLSSARTLSCSNSFLGEITRKSPLLNKLATRILSQDFIIQNSQCVTDCTSRGRRARERMVKAGFSLSHPSACSGWHR